MAARLARSMAEALEAAHAKEIVHRDIKPENVFVQAQPPDSVKLVDFGIAKLAGDFRAGQVHQTRSGAMMGTPLYMSPEQCRDSASIDYRTDLYSLGCVLFEMLTGRPPFTHDALGDLIVAHMNEAPPDARTINPAVPAALAELTGALLRKDRAQRPADMRTVAARLAGILAAATTVPGPGAPAPAAAPAPTAASVGPRTTFGDAASELVDGEARPSRRGRVGIAVAIGAVVLAAGGWLVARAGRAPSSGPAGAGVVATASPPVRAEPPAPSADPPSPPTRPSPEGAAAAVPAATGPSPSGKSPPPGRVKKQGDHRSAEATAPAAGLKLAREDVPSTAPPPAGSAEAPAPDVAGLERARENAPSTAPPAPPRSADATGAWEGPWTDVAHRQHGRLYFQRGANGVVAGWLYNDGARQSYRMSGRMAPSGALDLTCLCPAQQNFTARGTLLGAAEGELRGQLVLSTAAGAFGQSQVVLRPATPR